MSKEPHGKGPHGQELSLEEMLKKLEDIARSLEAGDQPLEGALGLFEEGIKLAKLGHERIDAAEKRIDILLGAGTKSERVAPFDDGE